MHKNTFQFTDTIHHILHHQEWYTDLSIHIHQTWHPTVTYPRVIHRLLNTYTSDMTSYSDIPKSDRQIPSTALTFRIQWGASFVWTVGEGLETIWRGGKGPEIRTLYWLSFSLFSRFVFEYGHILNHISISVHIIFKLLLLLLCGHFPHPTRQVWDSM